MFQTFEADEAFTPTAGRPDGSRWPFVLNWQDGRMIAADTRTELCAVLIDGYSDDEAEAQTQRWSMLANLAAWASVSTVQQLTEDGLFHPEELSEDRLTALMGEKLEPSYFEGAWPDGVAPLVVLALHYQPYTDQPVPAGDDVVVLDGGDETKFIDSFSALGLCELMVDEA